VSPEERSQTNDEQIVLCTSAFDCGGRCPLRVHVKDGVITRIEGDDYSDEDKQLRACWRGYITRTVFSTRLSVLVREGLVSLSGLPGTKLWIPSSVS